MPKYQQKSVSIGPKHVGLWAIAASTAFSTLICGKKAEFSVEFRDPNAIGPPDPIDV